MRAFRIGDVDPVAVLLLRAHVEPEEHLLLVRQHHLRSIVYKCDTL